MNHLDVPHRWIAGLGVVLTLMFARSAALAFGGAGNLGECTTFTSCTAGVYSSAVSYTKYTVSASPSFPLGSLAPGVNDIFDIDSEASTLPASSPNSACGPLCANSIPWPSRAVAHSQSDFGVNRAGAETGIGAVGTDNRGATTVANVSIQTAAEASSSWRDVWTFSGNGHFSAAVMLDGRSSTETQNASWPLSFTYNLAASTGAWSYRLRVWDTMNLSPDSDGFAAPTLLTEVRSVVANEQRTSFAQVSALDFDYAAGVGYVVIAEMFVNAGNGREVNLYNTARVGDVVLTPGTALNALSGHDYVSSAVPEPQTVALLTLGLALVGWAGRRQRRSQTG